MRMIPPLLLAFILLPTTIRAAECRATSETLRVRVDVKPKKNISLAGVVLSVDYPADRLVIEGQGKDAAKAAVSKIPADAFMVSEDLDGEVRLVVAKAKALNLSPLCEVVFHRCAGAAKAAARDVTCRLTDVSDTVTNKVDLDDVTCTVDSAS